MRKRHYTEAQIVAILKELDASRPAADSRANMACTSTRCGSGAANMAGWTLSDLARLKELESESVQMERIIARQALEIRAMSEVIRKNGWGSQREKKR